MYLYSLHAGHGAWKCHLSCVFKDSRHNFQRVDVSVAYGLTIYEQSRDGESSRAHLPSPSINWRALYHTLVLPSRRAIFTDEHDHTCCA